MRRVLMFKSLHWMMLLPCLAGSGTVIAAAQTFGLDGTLSGAQTRPQPGWLQQAQMLEKNADWPGLLAWGQSWAQSDAANPLAWFVQGRAFSAMGRLPEAIEAYERNVRVAPADVFALNNLGNAYRDSGRPLEAMQTYRIAVEIEPGYVQAWHNLGLTFYLSKGQAGVIKALRKLQATDPSLAEVWRKLAIEYSITRDVRVANEAVKVLRGLNQEERVRMFGILMEEG